MRDDDGDMSRRLLWALAWVLLLGFAVQCWVVVPAVIIMRAWRGG